MQAQATNYTMNVPGTALRLPVGYPEAGGVAIVMIGANGNTYYQFSDPTGAFQGYSNTGNPAAFRGNPFTINNPIALDCGASSCATYFGGSIAQVFVRFSILDGDTGPGEFDLNDITLRLNGFDISSMSGVTTERTNTAGTVSNGFSTGFTNNTFNTGWFSSTNTALLSNILSTGRTLSQVYDRDPADNYWDFRVGPTLTNGDIVTVAPGYELTKATDPATVTTYATVGQVINYRYEITNIGSVPIRDITLQDDKIGTVSCTPTTLLDVNFGQTPNKAICTASYTITQADIDNRSLTNVAVAKGTPDFGTLGTRTASVTITGPALTPSVTLDKATVLTAFGNAGTTVPYTFSVQNTGNATLTNVVVTDPRVPGLSCTTASLAPQAIASCAASYTVTQANVDGWATSGTQLSNTATVNARSPLGALAAVNDSVALPGPASVVTLTLDKAAQLTPVTKAGDVIPYRFTMRNTGNLTWPAPPTVTDPLIPAGVSCPAGTVAPGASVICTANYTVTQSDIDAGSVVNTASASITAGGATGTATDTETVPATRSPAMTFDKRLAAASPTSFNAVGAVIAYEFAFTNTGNVTLNTLAVNDPLITAITCPATVAPGATAVCTGSYTTTQADLEAGQVVNTAAATARSAGTNAVINAPSDSVTVPAVQTRSMSMDKTAPTITAPDFQAGLTVTYSYLVTNTGNVALPGPLDVIDDVAGTFTCQTAGLARGEAVTCTRVYTFTTADEDAGVVTNVATARAGTTATGQTTSNSDAVTIAPNQNQSVSLTKAASPTTATSTATPITYTFTVTNDGDSRINRATQPITISDPRAGSVDCSNQPSRFNRNTSFTCTATITPTQAEVDAGTLVNRATASFPFTSGGQTRTFTSPEATATVTFPATPGVSVTKTGPADFTIVGQSITFGFAVQNTGNVTLTSGAVTDPMIPGLSCAVTNLAPGNTQACTGNYTITQADVDAGQVANTATVTAATRGGASVTDSDSTTVPVNPANAIKSLTLDKVADRLTFGVGQQITYTFRVTNTGTQTLLNTVVTDTNFPSFRCTIPSVAPTVTNTSCVFSYTATQADFDAGRIINAAAATAPDAPVGTDQVTVAATGRLARYEFTKVADGQFAAVGDVVTFTLRVRNTGNVTLTNINVTDAFFTPDLVCTIATLGPGLADSSCAGRYTIVQADVDAGQITNTASITVMPPAGLTATGPATATSVVDGPAAAPAIVVFKQSSATSFDLGDSLTYTFSVQNTGNVTLQNVVVNDPTMPFSCTLADLAPGATATTCADASPLRATRGMTQADVDAGGYSNEVTVTATSSAPGGAVVNSLAELRVVGPVQTPAMTVAKTGTPGTFDAVGDIISYDYVITNTGNISLTAAVTVTDDRIARVTCPPTPVAGIPVNGTIVCAGSYRITQADLDAGSVANTASASADQQVVPRNPGDPSTVPVASPPVTETVTATQIPALRITKRVADGSASSFNNVTDTVTYLYTVTNTGNVTTTTPVTVADDQIAGTLTCAAAPLAPGASVTCTQVWTATQAALDAGEVVNTATASTVFGGARVDSAPASTAVPALQTPAIAISKTLAAPVPGSFSAGEVLNYAYQVRNTGNVSLLPTFTVTDNLTTVTCPSLPATLAPQATFNCTASYTIGVNDLSIGSTTNTARALATFGGNPVTSTPDSITFPVDSSPALGIAKSVSAGAIFASAGDTVAYAFTVTNTGGAGFVQPVVVHDDKIGALSCWEPTAADPSFDPASGGNPGQQAICTASYVVTQDDLDRGFVTNTATAATIFAPGGPAIPVESPAASATATAQSDPALQVTKAVTPASPNPAAVGDTLTYQITTENTGNQTILGVTVTDPLIPTLNCTRSRLAPTQTVVCTGTYVVTQSDLDAASATGPVLANTAMATGTSPLDTPVSASGSTTHPLQPIAPAVTVTKALQPDPGSAPAFSGPGETLTFVVTVRNTGNVTLTASTVTDDLDPAASCTVGSLAPGDADTSCTFTYTTTQADMDAVFGLPGSETGGFVNTASAQAQPITAGAAAVGADGQLQVPGPLQTRELTLSKTATEVNFAAAGDIINYTYAVINTSNITLTAAPVVTDDKIATVTCDAPPSGGLAPGNALACTATYTVTQADVDAGAVVNVASVASTDVPVAGPAATATETVPAVRTPGLTVAKSASITTDAQVGDDIVYTYTLRNTGNVTLTAVTPTDAHTSAAGTADLAIAGDALSDDVAPPRDSTDAAANGAWDTLAPGDAVTFTAAYRVTQADVDVAAPLKNTVTAAATGPTGVTVPPASVGLSVPVAQLAGAMDIQKLADLSALTTPPTAGQRITYAITVANTGGITLSAPALTDVLTDATGTARNLDVGPDYVGGDTNTDLQLNVDEVWTYTARLTLTQGMLDSGALSNSVVADANNPSGAPVSDTSDDDDGATDRDGDGDPANDPTVTTFDLQPGLAAVKTALFTIGSDNVASVGDTISYSYTITNTGNATVLDVVPTETGFTGAGPTPQPAYVSGGVALGGNGLTPDLRPGDAVTFAVTYTLVQADVDRGNVTNQATAAGTTPAGQPVRDLSGATPGDDDATVITFPRLPSIVVVKAANLAGLQSPAQAGDPVVYSIRVANTGNVTLPAPVLADTLTAQGGGALTLTSGPTLASGDDGDGLLEVSETWVYSARFDLTQAAIDAGGVANTVTATVTDPVEGPISDVSDDGLPGDGNGDGDPGNDPTTTTLDRAGALTVTKDVDTASQPADPVAGDDVIFNITLANTGNVTLSAPALTDVMRDGAGNLVTPAPLPVFGTGDANINSLLDVGETWSYTVTVPLTVDLIDSGGLDNTATGRGTPPGAAALVVDDGATVSFPNAPAISTVKSAVFDPGPDGRADVGDAISYTYAVTNQGNLTLFDISVVETGFRGAGPLPVPVYVSGGGTYGGTAGIADVRRDETALFTAIYTLTQADIDAGEVVNQASGAGSSPDGAPVRDPSGSAVDNNTPTTTLLPATAAIIGEKTLTAAPVTVGSQVSFLITATNAGNVTLTGVGVSSDRLRRADGTFLTPASGPVFNGSSAGSPAGQLLPGEMASYALTYRLTQADIDAGGISNSAIVRGVPPSGLPITDITDDGDDADGNTLDDATVLTIPAAPAMTMVKRLAPGADPTFSTVGQMLNYEFVVRNSGNVTLIDQIVITDPLIQTAGGAITCPAPPLAPAATLTCTGSYAVTQADLDAGEVVNTATSSDGTATSPSATATVPALQEPALTTVKQARPIAPRDFVVGAVITYTYTVTNSGNVTITDPISIADNRIAAANLTCPALPPRGLRPLGTLGCTGTYVVTATDVNLGSVTNLASATDGTTTSPLVSETVPDAATPSLTTTKEADAGAVFAAVGDQIGYTYTVTNTGTRAFVNAVTISDDRIPGPVICFMPNPPADPDFRAGETISCTATYTVTQDDLDAGEVVNQAFSQTSFGSPAQTVNSPAVAETVAATRAPALTLTKAVAPNPVTAVGDTLTYTFTVENTGNQTVRGITVTDALLPGLTCTLAELLPTTSQTCTDSSYVVTQADIDRGRLVNTATVAGRSPQGEAVMNTASVTADMPASAPALVLTKTAIPSPFGAVGSALTYRFAVENTGNTTLRNVVVTDPADRLFRCAIAAIAPATTDQTCALTTTVTQAQVDAGSIENTATAAGTDPFGTPATDSDTITTTGPPAAPALEVTKIALPSAITVGSPLRYELRVENTGNVSLTGVAPADTMTRLTGAATALDAPFTLASGDTDADGQLDVAEIWVFTARHTLVQDDIDAGGLSNTATVSAAGVRGGNASDVSDNGIDDDGNTVNDPTVFTIAPGPALTATKVVSAQDGVAAGDSITFTITALNSGNVTITDPSITDTLTRADGPPLAATTVPVSVPNPLPPGAEASWAVTYTLLQADIDAGGIRNTATVGAIDQGGAPVTDVSADGDNGDGNITDDPTEVLIPNAPGIEAIKTLVSVGNAAGEAALFTVEVENTGNTTLTAVTVTDAMTRFGGDPVGPVAVALQGSSLGSVEGTLLPGEIATYTVTYTLVQDDVDAAGLENQATASGQPPAGGPVTDLSDDTGGAGEDDPTVAPIDQVSSLEVRKTAGAVSSVFPTVDRVTFTIAVQNTGLITQTALRVSDDLAAYLAPATLLSASYPVQTTVAGFGAGTANVAYNGASNTELLAGNARLGPGATGTITVTLTYSTANGQPGGSNIAGARSTQSTATTPSNPVTVTRPDSDGDGVPDDLEGTGDRDGDGIPNDQDYDPTGYFYCEDNGRILTGGSISVVRIGGGTAAINIVNNGANGQYQFFVTEAGTYQLQITYPPGTGPSLTLGSSGALDVGALLPANPAVIGSSQVGATGLLADFSAGANPWFTTFVIDEGDPFVLNNNIPVAACFGPVADVAATKVADRETAVLGETINYTLTFANSTARLYLGASFVDRLPAGLAYVPGSGQVSGVATEPAIDGQRLTWGPRDVVGAETVTVRFAARVTSRAGPGDRVNLAVMVGANGAEVSNVATATVRVVPEAVFDCSDVIGKVFDDINRNGVQDPYDPRAAITDQDIFIDKYGKLASPETEVFAGEPGVPGVRIATVNGLLITTDEYGRFHVPCAALPADTGSNFTLKLDTRTLPVGYALTTENPRTLRLTSGKVAKMNFGVALTEFVDIGLTARAFVTGTAQPGQALVDGVKALIARIADTPSTLRLTYLLAGAEDRAGAVARLRATEDLIRRIWRGVGRYDLQIDKSVKQE